MIMRLAAISRDIASDSSAGDVAITVTPAFGARWLLPKLSLFQRGNPDIAIRLDASLALSNLDVEPVDFAIRYGLGTWQGVVSELFIAEDLTPICVPGLLPRHAASLEALANLTLLHDTSDEAWSVWLRAADHRDLLDQAASATFNDYNLLVEAVLNGLGVGMGRTQLIADHLDAGRLVAPFALRVPSPRAHHLVRSRQPLRPAAQAVWDWLLSLVSAVQPDQTVGIMKS